MLGDGDRASCSTHFRVCPEALLVGFGEEEIPGHLPPFVEDAVHDHRLVVVGVVDQMMLTPNTSSTRENWRAIPARLWVLPNAIDCPVQGGRVTIDLIPSPGARTVEQDVVKILSRLWDKRNGPMGRHLDSATHPLQSAAARFA